MKTIKKNRNLIRIIHIMLWITDYTQTNFVQMCHKNMKILLVSFENSYRFVQFMMKVLSEHYALKSRNYVNTNETKTSEHFLFFNEMKNYLRKNWYDELCFFNLLTFFYLLLLFIVNLFIIKLKRKESDYCIELNQSNL